MAIENSPTASTIRTNISIIIKLEKVPKNPNTCPDLTSKSIPSTAVTLSYDLESELVTIHDTIRSLTYLLISLMKFLLM